jgi:hypothetical protein
MHLLFYQLDLIFLLSHPASGIEGVGNVRMDIYLRSEVTNDCIQRQIFPVLINRCQ